MTWTQDPEAVARIERLIEEMANSDNCGPIWTKARALKDIIAPPVDPDLMAARTWLVKTSGFSQSYVDMGRCDGSQAITTFLAGCAHARELAEQDTHAAVEREREAVLIAAARVHGEAQDTEWDNGFNFAKRKIMQAIRDRSQEGE